MSRFFIDRPVFAWVIAILVMLAGSLAIMTLPVEQYPRIAPPAVQITAFYPGASAQTVENTVTQVIEQKMNGLDHLRYMSSTSDSVGNVAITLTFEPKADPDIAQVQVQNKLQLATPLLPQEVQAQGLKVVKATNNFLLVISLVSEDDKYSQTDLSDMVVSLLQDPLSRVTGVGDVTTFGAQHAMRVWLNPDKMTSYSLTTTDVETAIKSENAEVSGGQLGGNPAVSGQQLNATVLVQNRLETPEQFSQILLRVNQDGSQIRLKDVARVEIGAENYEVVARENGHPTAAIGIKLASGANALDTVKAVKAELDVLKKFLPQDVTISMPYDTTPYVRLSIHEVYKTLGEAIVLVVLVMYLFLQNFRATLIPAIAVPVVLLGTFGMLAACGFTINTLTMFGMVLAIGLLVDDAIVVVENVERIMTDEGLPPREATRKSMDQITGALVGIALVLSAVFVPMAFMSGSTGAIFRQFSLTLVSAMGLSVLVALVLTPALCATILRPATKEHGTTGFFGWFNRSFDKGRRLYVRSLRQSVRHTSRFWIAYVAIVGVLGVLLMRLPTAFLPEEDQGLIFTQIQAPIGATTERTRQIVDNVVAYYRDKESGNVENILALTGFNFAGRGQNAGMLFIKLKDWSLRPRSDQKAQAIVGRAFASLSQIRDAMVFPFTPPAVIELGNANGFDFELLDRGGVGHAALMQARNQLLGMASQNPALIGVRPNGLEDAPQFRILVDREKSRALGISLDDINNTVSASWGSAYVNDFIDRGRVKKVYIQADAPYRMQPSDFARWEVRNGSGGMVPFSTFSTGRWEYGSLQLERYDGVSSREIMGSPKPGHSSGEAMAAMEEMAKALPAGITYQWTGLSYEERLAGSQAPVLYALSILVVFLCLAALYESWSIPVSVMLVVPLGVIGAVAAVAMCGLSNDVYFQVGLLTTIGLSAKNAILIVEFAKEHYEGGRSLHGAVLEAGRQRLRPILMTSLAFLLGVVPLTLANGAGSGAQNDIGIGVTGGMVTATVLAIFFVPVFFVTIFRRFGKMPKRVPLKPSKPALS